LTRIRTEETFTGYVESWDEECICLFVTSSNGEEAMAWLPWKNIPEDQRANVSLGADFKCEVYIESVNGTHVRKCSVEFRDFSRAVHEAATKAIAAACADLKAKGIPRVGLDEDGNLVYDDT